MLSRCLIGGMKGKSKIVIVGKIGKKVRLLSLIFSSNETSGNKGNIGKKGKIGYQVYFFSKSDTQYIFLVSGQRLESMKNQRGNIF